MLRTASTKSPLDYTLIKKRQHKSMKSLDLIATGGGSSIFSKSIEKIEQFVAGNSEAGKVTHINSVEKG